MPVNYSSLLGLLLCSCGPLKPTYSALSCQSTVFLMLSQWHFMGNISSPNSIFCLIVPTHCNETLHATANSCAFIAEFFDITSNCHFFLGLWSNLFSPFSITENEWIYITVKYIKCGQNNTISIAHCSMEDRELIMSCRIVWMICRLLL